MVSVLVAFRPGVGFLKGRCRFLDALKGLLSNAFLNRTPALLYDSGNIL
ncbi:hypothetical protein [Vampirovibrio sp.]